MSTSHEDAHRQCGELLPWYLNGTLPEDERLFIERHVSACLPCRKTIEEERRLSAFVADSSSSPDSLEHGLQRLLRRVDADGRVTASAHRARVHRYALAAAASLAALAVTFWALAPDAPPAAGEFRTLTSTGGTPAARFDVVFGGSTSRADVDSLLRSVGATVVTGPSEIGRYTIELEADTPAALEGSLDVIRGDPSVRLLAPAYDDGGNP